MHGLHLIADLHGCRCPAGFLLDAPALEAFSLAACERHGLTVVGRCFHQFRDEAGEPSGVTGTVVLAESHVAVHTWPELAGVTLDVYVCNFSTDNSAPAHALFQEIIAAFAPARAETRQVLRGRLGSSPP
ncbi:MAG TPA: adenosylmethionine decarboxylase [Rhodocyclaceae bacterium]|nr:adenosylmethionine decarboxylase [Rhodocyclaceae bacterium]